MHASSMHTRCHRWPGVSGFEQQRDAWRPGVRRHDDHSRDGQRHPSTAHAGRIIIRPPLAVVAQWRRAAAAEQRAGRCTCRALSAAAPSAGPSLSSLFVASLMPVLKVALLCSVGAAAAAQGLLSAEGRRVISTLIINIFVPCLFLDQLAAGEGFASALKLWPLTFNMVATHVLGAVLGAVLVWTVRPPPHVWRHMLLATVVGNTGNLPLVLIASMGADPSLAWLGGAELGVQCVVIANLSATLIQFPVCLLLLKKKQEQRDAGTAALRPASPSPGPPAPWWKPLQPLAAGLLSPPTLAYLVGLGVASVKPVQALFYSPAAPLRIVAEATHMLGNVAIPALMLVLGANLSRGPGAGGSKGGMPVSCILATIVCRLVALPLAGTALVQAMRAGGLLQGMEPIGVISMLLMHAVPSAIVIHTLATMLGDAPDEVATLLFWEYLASALTLPAMLAFFLHLVAKPG